MLPKNLESVFIRLDFFSKPMFCNCLVDLLNGTRFKDFKYYCRLLDTSEQERIDIDAISQNLSISIEEILSQSVNIYKGSECDLDINVIFSNFFVWISFKNMDDCNIRTMKDIEFEIFDKIKKLSDQLNPQVLSYSMISHLQTDKENIGVIFNPDYINITNYDELTNSRYADLYSVDNGNMNLKLIRDIFKGDIHGYENVIDVLISAIAECFIDDKNFKEIEFHEEFEKMSDITSEKIANCYK